MRHRGENGASSLLAGRASRRRTKLFPRSGPWTATQQYVLLSGMAAMYASGLWISRLRGRFFCLGGNHDPDLAGRQMHGHFGLSRLLGRGRGAVVAQPADHARERMAAQDHVGDQAQAQERETTRNDDRAEVTPGDLRNVSVVLVFHPQSLALR